MAIAAAFGAELVAAFALAGLGVSRYGSDWAGRILPTLQPDGLVIPGIHIALP